MRIDGISRVGTTMNQANLARTAQRAASLRTAVILASFALVFFGGFIAAQGSGWSMIGMGALGFAFLGVPLARITGRGRSWRRPPTAWRPTKRIVRWRLRSVSQA